MENQNKILENDCHELKFFMNENECDVTFIVEHKRIVANKWLLRLKSDVFDVMLSDDKFKESVVGIIEVEDTKYQVFKSMVRFLYTNKLVISEDNDYCMAIDVFICADKYHIKPLMGCVEKRLTKLISFDNMEQIYEFARRYDLIKLCNALNVFIKKNFDYYLIQSPDEIKRISILSESYLMELILEFKNTEIHRLEKILSELARNCVQCKNRITFSGI